ncbi:MAG TPA: 3-oxoacyl-[acyl-carrier-protein] reductase [Aggregatilineales bacterium]|nr:3-oxoacyl-[acyl-carrier-protein] reductase [Aggregatilineales bacterium]HPV06496.1 3-oxoacyl-[acyl-carrier-protein] reductase [Aggregatilineales bacterium]HQE18276.1 3-oxoacyl-[acyl-carrier-protein] reductase [Aggregatilineales bacterium]
MSRLDERIAIVTGASRGIGRAIAEELARRGARVVVNYNSSAAAAEEVVQAICNEGGEAIAVQADVSDMEQAQQLVKATLDAYGGLDILVNNAGTTRDMLLMMMSESDWDDVLRINLKSAYNCSKAALRPMMRKRYGRIINMTSVAGIAGNPGQTNYSASKAGLIGFTKSLAREVGSRNITVNAVAPGFVPTELTASLPEEIREASIQQIPLGRWGTAEEVAFAVAFLASDEASYITGHVLSVDGGMVMG